MSQLNDSDRSLDSINSDHIAPSAVMGLCCLIGVFGNVAVVSVIVCNHKRGDLNFTLKLMLNLAFSDILSLLTLPVWIYNLLHGWTLGLGACKFTSYVVISSLYVSVLTVTLMSVQRYVAVLYSQYWARLRGTGKRALLVALWVLAGVLASPAIALGDVVGQEMQCKWHYRSDTEEAATLFMEILLGFVVPFSILVTSYFCLHKKVNQTTFFSSQRMTRLVTSIVVTFFIFWSPVHITNILQISAVLLKSKTLKNFVKNCVDYTQALTFLNSCVNPFLYAFATRCRKENTEQSTTSQVVSTSNL
ncbi:leukotriene B4 receptor 1-like [Conger conger]|uniref:leukotriene B4 receptor 1-like n=1 Tax=Conger conger TaxID=82655 RepID=UPI002A5AFC32|nr:leukotriene B4 receptor 1-like [Conger conger]